MNNIFYSVEQGSLFGNVIIVDTAIYSIYSIRFLAGECNLSCRAFVLVLLQAVLFSLMKIEDQFLSQFCKFMCKV